MNSLRFGLTVTLLCGLCPAGAPAQAVAAPSIPSAPVRDSDVAVLPEFKVDTSRHLDDYVASEAISGTRTGAKILELPFGVDVLTKEFIEDFRLYEQDEQMRFTANFTSRDPDSGTGGGNRLRGFEPLQMRDGLSRTSPADLTNIAQVEIIRGPQSALYGQAEPGGIVNYLSKRPKERPGYRLTLANGNYDTVRTELEATGPLVGDKLFYLVTAGYRANKTDLEHYYSRRKIYTTTFTYKFTRDTSLTAYWEQSRTTSNRGTGAVGLLTGSRQSGTNPLVRTGGIVSSVYLPLIRFNQMGPNDHYVRDYDGANLRLEHRFSPIWSARVNYELVWKEFHQDRWSSGINYVPETGRLTSRTPFHQNQFDRAQAVQVDLLGRFRAGGVPQQVLFAGDYYREIFENQNLQYSTADIANTALLKDTMRYLDPRNPDWTPADLSRVTRFTNLQLRRFFVKGATASYRATLAGGRLVAMASVRRNYLSVLVDDLAAANFRKGYGSHQQDTWSTGANLRLAGDAVVAYANYSTSLNTGVSVDGGTGRIQRPERGRGPEVGFKGVLAGERYSYTLAAFDIEKDNIATPNPDYVAGVSPAGVPQYLGQGREQGKGVDLSFSARVTPALTLLGTIGYVDARIRQHETASLIGDRLTLVADKTASAVARYSFLQGPLKNLRIGASWTYTGGTLVSAATAARAREFHSPYQLVNAFASYTWRQGRFRHTLALNGGNLFDKFYLNPSNKLGRGRETSTTYTVTF
ncbi:MAG: TonB-dependent receptor [Verrucomicrobia bacterium]|nr:TonB-dependent receptor [Verrucomicrobiota bacterium]